MVLKLKRAATMLGSTLVALMVLSTTALGPLTVLSQLRILAALTLGVLILASSRPQTRPKTGRLIVGTTVLLIALIALGLNDALRLSAPWIIWPVALSPLVALSLAFSKRHTSAPWAALGLTLFAAIIGTPQALSGAFWALAGALCLSYTLERTHPIFTGFGLGLLATGTWHIASSAHLSVGTYPLAGPTWALSTGVAALLIAFWLPTRKTMTLLVALSVAAPLTLAPPLPGLSTVAAHLERPRLPADDVRGWRRLYRLQHRATTPSPPDAGPL